MAPLIFEEKRLEEARELLENRGDALDGGFDVFFGGGVAHANMMGAAKGLAGNNGDVDFIQEFLRDLKTAQTCSLNIREKIKSAVGFEGLKRFHGLEFFNEKIATLLEHPAHFLSLGIALIQRDNAAGLRE